MIQAHELAQPQNPPDSDDVIVRDARGLVQQLVSSRVPEIPDN